MMEKELEQMLTIIHAENMYILRTLVSFFVNNPELVQEFDNVVKEFDNHFVNATLGKLNEKE